MDTKARSWVKSIVWRVVGVILLGGISYSVIGNWRDMTIITTSFHGIRVVMYYFHERLWERISWGRLKHPLATVPVKNNLTPEELRIATEKLKELGYIE